MRAGKETQGALIIVNSTLFKDISNVSTFVKSLNRFGFTNVSVIEHETTIEQYKAQFPEQTFFAEYSNNVELAKNILKGAVNCFSVEELNKATPYITAIDRAKKHFKISDSKKILLVNSDWNDEFFIKILRDIHMCETTTRFSNYDFFITEKIIKQVAGDIKNKFIKKDFEFSRACKTKSNSISPHHQPETLQHHQPAMPYGYWLTMNPSYRYAMSQYTQPMIPQYSNQQPQIFPSYPNIVPKPVVPLPHPASGVSVNPYIQPASTSMSFWINPTAYIPIELTIPEKVVPKQSSVARESYKLPNFTTESQLLHYIAGYHSDFCEIYNKLKSYKDSNKISDEEAIKTLINSALKPLSEKIKQCKGKYIVETYADTKLKSFILKFHRIIYGIDYRINYVKNYYTTELKEKLVLELLHLVEEGLACFQVTLLKVTELLHEKTKLSALSELSYPLEKNVREEEKKSEKGELGEEMKDELDKKRKEDEVLESGKIPVITDKGKRTWREIVGIDSIADVDTPQETFKKPRIYSSKDDRSLNSAVAQELLRRNKKSGDKIIERV
ncbi:hypothetical protein NF27_DT00490 [Candidatus Jidaibacter acanthamoeba]|uniref:Uncharacterized protein n=1 Tax=Candidatus Jidaibacter acanthamoebae TaxID=86105 RepID=A0A0C1QZ43_9RICK|nr:hypothetical protein [Candidatus Jidaibacter acanthamoeba]KIE05275.1 hypothetical protein NF27_DT00490 [Candidatus Jidaibacter acanthamoeba]